ncbi:MAG: hypothetical protein JKY45_15095 [Emcibacter sp.]|nr:hypothetical protein [Emcibacter sp.]
MFKAIQTSVSGLIASSVRFNAASSNIINAQVKSTPKGSTSSSGAFNPAYNPQQVKQSTTASGGVRANVVQVSPSSLTLFDPTSPLANAQGNVDIPNISLPAEISELTRASQSYKANATVLKNLDETFKTLLKI